MYNQKNNIIKKIIVITYIILPLSTQASKRCKFVFNNFVFKKENSHQPAQNKFSELILLEQVITTTESTSLAIENAIKILKKEMLDLNNKTQAPIHLFQKNTNSDSKEDKVIDLDQFQQMQQARKDAENDLDKMERIDRITALLEYELNKLTKLSEILTNNMREAIQATLQTKSHRKELNRIRLLNKTRNALKHVTLPHIMSKMSTAIDKAVEHDIIEALTEVMDMYNHLSAFIEDLGKKIKTKHSDSSEDTPTQPKQNKDVDDSFLPNIINEEPNQPDDYVDIKDSLHETRFNKNQMALAQEVKNQRNTHSKNNQQQPKQSKFFEIIFLLEKILTAVNKKQFAIDTTINSLESQKRLAKHNLLNLKITKLSLAESIQTDILRYSLFPKAQAQQIDGMITPLKNENKVLENISKTLIHYIRKLINADSKAVIHSLMITFLNETNEDIDKILNSNIITRMNKTVSRLTDSHKIIEPIIHLRIMYESNDFNDLMHELNQQFEKQNSADSN